MRCSNYEVCRFSVPHVRLQLFDFPLSVCFQFIPFIFSIPSLPYKESFVRFGHLVNIRPVTFVESCQDHYHFRIRPPDTRFQGSPTFLPFLHPNLTCGNLSRPSSLASISSFSLKRMKATGTSGRTHPTLPSLAYETRSGRKRTCDELE